VTTSTPAAAGRRTVAIALSGGVDSAVAALCLVQSRRPGDELVAIHLRTWDARDEAGPSGNTPVSASTSPRACTADQDEAAARAVASALGLPLVVLDAVSDYWCDVFAPFASAVGSGLVPNPDLACNAALKFGSVAARVRGELGADALATGHYARVGWGWLGREEGHVARVVRPDHAAAADDGDPWAARPWDGSAADASTPPPSLLVGRDPAKDQSYFLASVPGEALRSALFPVGGMTKAAVRTVAASHRGLAAALAGRRSSAGICFVGRRRFGEFMEGYAPPVPGVFRAVPPSPGRLAVGGGDGRSGETPADERFPCRNVWALTHGQRAPVGGTPSKLYVAGKDLATHTVWVAPGRDHPALFCGGAALGEFAWVGGRPPSRAEIARASGGAGLTYRARYRQPPRPCSLSMEAGALERFEASAFNALPAATASTAAPALLPPAAAVVSFSSPARAITPAQALVLYAGPVCLGTAPVVAPGLSLWEGGVGTVPPDAAAAAAAEGEAGWAVAGEGAGARV
jgi:tRNA-5-taurinomethyluridine 2-sulfurtransferase